MSVFLRFFAIAAFIFGITFQSFARQRTTTISWLYHPNRPGVEAYMQGGAFVANTGSVTAMLFNPAGLAQMPGRLTAAVETGWASRTEYLNFRNVDLVAGFQPVQFAGIAFQPGRKFAVGAFYTRPTNYNLERGRFLSTGENHPDETGEFVEPVSRREQTSLGMAFATAVAKNFSFGGGLEWRRSRFHDQILRLYTKGQAEAVRFSIGAILQIRDWNMGISAQGKYNAAGDGEFTPISDILDTLGQRIRYDPLPLPFQFSIEEPASIRLGIATPYAFDRLRLSADAEYKDFNSEDPIERWQFYGGGMVKLMSNVDLSFGAFTFRKDYSAYIEGPKSEIFWTVGASVEISQFRFSGSFMDGDLLTEGFVGQRFINFAVGFVVP